MIAEHPKVFDRSIPGAESFWAVSGWVRIATFANLTRPR
jgi:hypothetical protein